MPGRWLYRVLITSVITSGLVLVWWAVRVMVALQEE